MRPLEHTTDIQAPAATVWQVLTATEQYQQWNPFTLSLTGALVVWHRLTVTMRAGRQPMTFRSSKPSSTAPSCAGRDGWVCLAFPTVITSCVFRQPHQGPAGSSSTTSTSTARGVGRSCSTSDPRPGSGDCPSPTNSAVAADTPNGVPLDRNVEKQNSDARPAIAPLDSIS